MLIQSFSMQTIKVRNYSYFNTHQQKCTLLENACWNLRCLSKHLKEPQVLASNIHFCWWLWGSWDVWTSQMSSWWLVWTQMSLSPPQMSCWSSSGGIRDGGKSRNAHVQFIPQNGHPNTAWAAQGGSKPLLSHKRSDQPMGHHQMYGSGPWATPWAGQAELWQHYICPYRYRLL